MKKLMMLGGLRYLIPAIEEAHRLGIHVITVDYVPDNIAHKYSDEYYNVSTMDKEAVLELARRIQIDGITAFGVDAGVVSAAYVADKMGLPFHCSYASTCILQDKALFRDFLAKNGFNTPKAKGYADIDEALKDIDEFSWPVVVKPVDSCGSKGVVKVEKKEDFRNSIEYAVSESHNGRFIIEDYLDTVGYQSSTDMFSVNGILDMPLFSDQVFDSLAPNPYVPTVEIWPTTMPIEYQSDLINQINRLFALLGCKNGLYNIECRVCSNGKAYLMEVSPRGGGNHIALIQDMAYGINYIENEIRNAVGLPLNLKKAKDIDGCWCTYSLHPNKDQQGTFDSVVFREDVNKNNVKYVDLALKKGDVVKPFTGANMSLGDVLLHFDSRKELFDAVSEPSKWVNIRID